MDSVLHQGFAAKIRCSRVKQYGQNFTEPLEDVVVLYQEGQPHPQYHKDDDECQPFAVITDTLLRNQYPRISRDILICKRFPHHVFLDRTLDRGNNPWLTVISVVFYPLTKTVQLLQGAFFPTTNLDPPPGINRQDDG